MGAKAKAARRAVHAERKATIKRQRRTCTRCGEVFASVDSCRAHMRDKHKRRAPTESGVSP